MKVHGLREETYNRRRTVMNIFFSDIPVQSCYLFVWSFLFICECAKLLEFYFPDAYIPQREGKLIHEVALCIKRRSICHRLLPGSVWHLGILQLVGLSIRFPWRWREPPYPPWGWHPGQGENFLNNRHVDNSVFDRRVTYSPVALSLSLSLSLSHTHTSLAQV